MDENNRPQEQSRDLWLEELLRSHESAESIGVDEQAVTSAGLTHPADLEVERIMQEILDEVAAEEAAKRPPAPVAPTPEPETFKDDEFRDTFGEGEGLTRIFNDDPLPPDFPPTPVNDPASEQEEPEENEEEQPVEKGRPKKKEGSGLYSLPHLFATFIWLAIIVAIGVSVGRLGWLCASDVLALGRTPISASITIEPGDDMDAIAEKLQDAGLIQYPGIFKFYADITSAEEKIKPGTYNFHDVNEDNETIVYDYMALVAVMSPSSNRLVVVEDLRIPEGYTCAQIFQLLEDKKVCTVAELEAYAASGELGEYWFLEGVPRGDKYCLEGYLFPDTYDFYENDDPQRVLKKMLNGFDAAFTDVMRANLDKVKGYTFHELMIIASMIEKESASNAESYTVSSVIFNRLKDSANYPFLNIDATIVYALGGKADLTEEDLKLDHPYNTYTNKGLPPGPISNPSQNSIAAALTPEETKYYYYALDPETKLHHFSKTYAEHQAFLDSLKEDK